MTWDSVVTKHYRKYLKELNIKPMIEAYIQSMVLKKMFEITLFEYRRSIENEIDVKDRVEEAVKRFGEVSATGMPTAGHTKEKLRITQPQPFKQNKYFHAIV
ncbi:hypothetical protein TCON_0357 [Astathelohania contejeani]|uniref:Uncharacterized protein n=1 Tax=Astathelohania contejeani TaxID=164912 RepID=A0ABQ7I1V2_9MICR|nr:hypothetical protein TCON_0357 [Thelohania contejeani]